MEGTQQTLLKKISELVTERGDIPTVSLSSKRGQLHMKARGLVKQHRPHRSHKSSRLPAGRRAVILERRVRARPLKCCFMEVMALIEEKKKLTDRKK